MPVFLPRRLCRRRPFALLLFLCLCTMVYLLFVSDGGGFSLWADAAARGRAKAQTAYEKVLDQLQKPILPMEYGTNARPPLKEIRTVIADLPPHLVPMPKAERKKLEAEGTASSPNGRPPARRLIIVGDVHGQRAELEALLASVKFDRDRGDHLILTGDLVNKGPDSPGVVALAMELGASAVRGNHEDRVLLSHVAVKRPLVPVPGRPPSRTPAMSGGGGGVEEEPEDKAESDRIMDALKKEPFTHGDAADRETGASLTEAQLNWLESLPVILRVGRISGSILGEVVVVHAGLVPMQELERQDPWAAMNMRGLRYPAEEHRRMQAREKLEKIAESRANGRPYHVSGFAVEQELARMRKMRDSAVRKGRNDPWAGDRDVMVPVRDNDRASDPWSVVWDHWTEREVDPEQRVTVVFGHDAKKGLNVGKWSIGLDSGCVYGKKLSALVIEEAEHKVTHKVVSVKCSKAADPSK